MKFGKTVVLVVLAGSLLAYVFLVEMKRPDTTELITRS